MYTIFSKEFRNYFRSPIGYVFLSFYLFLCGFYFSGINLDQLSGDYSVIFYYLVNLLLFTIPLLTMRLLSEERKHKTDQLLLTAPIGVSEIVLGKYFSAVALFLLTLILTFIHPIILSFLGEVPWLLILNSYLGFFLLGSSLIAIGLFISSLTENQIIAALATIGTFLLFLLTDTLASFISPLPIVSLLCICLLIILVTFYLLISICRLVISLSIGLASLLIAILLYFVSQTLFDGLLTKMLQWFSLYTRYYTFGDGLLDLGAIIYYLSFIFVFIFLTIQTIQKRRWC